MVTVKINKYSRRTKSCLHVQLADEEIERKYLDIKDIKIRQNLCSYMYCRHRTVCCFVFIVVLLLIFVVFVFSSTVEKFFMKTRPFFEKTNYFYRI